MMKIKKLLMDSGSKKSKFLTKISLFRLSLYLFKKTGALKRKFEGFIFAELTIMPYIL
ncbi:hypothetical protein ES705_15569 [subsurface metagenome]